MKQCSATADSQTNFQLKWHDALSHFPNSKWCKQLIFNIIFFMTFRIQQQQHQHQHQQRQYFIGMLANVYVCFVPEKVKPKAFTSSKHAHEIVRFNICWELSARSSSIHWQNFNEFPKPFSFISQFWIVFFCCYYYDTLYSGGENKKSNPLNDFCMTGSFALALLLLTYINV